MSGTFPFVRYRGESSQESRPKKHEISYTSKVTGSLRRHPAIYRNTRLFSLRLTVPEQRCNPSSLTISKCSALQRTFFIQLRRFHPPCTPGPYPNAVSTSLAQQNISSVERGSAPRNVRSDTSSGGAINRSRARPFISVDGGSDARDPGRRGTQRYCR